MVYFVKKKNPLTVVFKFIYGLFWLKQHTNQQPHNSVSVDLWST